MIPTRNDFPPGFLFGAATSSYQIEGHAFGGAGRTHWDDFAATPGNVAGAENGEHACEHYHRLEEDLDLIAGLGVDVYRFSTSWARVLPEGRGEVNAAGLDFYDRLVDGLVARGIRPALTLYHWELPSALADLGGWRNRDIAGWMTDYARIVMDRIGDRLWSTATINEPWCVAWLSHFKGEHAPGLRDIRAAARATHHVLLAHGTVTEALRADGHDNLGVVINYDWAEPADESEAARAACATGNAIHNRMFAEPVFLGRYPDEVLTGIEPHLPRGWQGDMETIGAQIDWTGVNYYTRSLWQAAPQEPWPAATTVAGPLPKTQMGWEICPEGLYRRLLYVAEVSGGMPIYVTENGMANADRVEAGKVDDAARIDYLARHLGAVQDALEAGANVKGYFVWSLMDNFEWAYGYEPRFGLVHVDFDDMTRTPKRSYHALAQALDR